MNRCLQSNKRLGVRSIVLACLPTLLLGASGEDKRVTYVTTTKDPSDFGDAGRFSGADRDPLALPNFKQVRIPVPGKPGLIYGMLVVDMNGDGLDDIVTIDKKEKKLRVFLADKSLTFAKQYTKNYSYIGSGFVGAGDFSGDGKMDLAVATEAPQTWFVIFPGKGDGQLLAPKRIASTETVSTITCSATPDLDADGKPDVVACTSDLLTFHNLGGSRFAIAKVEAPWHYSWKNLAAGDFDGDGFPDLASGSSGGGVYLLRGKGDGTFSEAVRIKTGDVGSYLCAADLNNDKHLDLIGSGYMGRNWSLLGKGDGTFGKEIVLKNVPLAGTLITDITGDANPDLMASGNGIQLYQGLGNGNFSRAGQLGAGFNFWPVGAADLHADGSQDIVSDEWPLWGTGRPDNLVLFLNGETPATLSLSNLVITTSSYSGTDGIVRVAGSVSFQSSDAKVVYHPEGTDPTDSAFLDLEIRLDLPVGWSDVYIRINGTGEFMNLPGQTSGTIYFDFSAQSGVTSNTTFPVYVQGVTLFDYNLVRSNTLS